MSAIKKIFGAGDSRDENVMYQTEGSMPTSSTATDNVDRDIQSSRDIGTGAQDNPGMASRIGDTSNVQSQTAGTSSASSQPVTYASGAPEAHDTSGRDAGLATAGAAGATGATVYASDRMEGDDRRDDISKATYTERSYALSSGSDSTSIPTTSNTRTSALDPGRTTAPTGVSSTEGSGSNREAAVAGGAFGTTVLGAGAYAASNRDNDQLNADTSGRDIAQPEAVDSSGRLQPDHVPGAFPTDEGADPAPNKANSSALTGGVAAGGAGGAAYSSQSSMPTQSTQPTQQSETNYGRDAAIAGGAAAGAGAVGYGTYEATRDRDTATSGPHQSSIANKIDPRVQQEDSKKVQPAESRYSREAAAVGSTSASGAAIQQEDPKKVEQVESHYKRDAAAVGATSAVGAGAGAAVAGSTVERSEDNRVHADSSGHNYLHKKSVEEPGEKKQGFFSKAFHGHRKDEEVAIGDSNPANEVQRTAPAGSDRTPGLPHDDSGMITIHQAGTDPSAPALVVREKPDTHELVRDPTK